MKKFVILTASILLIAAACNKQSAVSPTPSPTPTPSSSNQLVYTNAQYGFTIDLQPDWTGYQVLNQSWQGTDVATGKQTQTGPEIILRHPKWTATAHYEDIPVMVFTPAQWNLVQQEKLSLGAAPIGPSKLDANSQYIFALPARYNYDYATGWQEADQIVHTLKATGSATSSMLQDGFNVDENSNGKTVTMSVGDTIMLTLHSSYWNLQTPSSVLTLLTHSSNPDFPGKGVAGTGTGIFTWSYTAAKTGTTKLSASRTTCGEALQCTPDQKNYSITIIVK